MGREIMRVTLDFDAPLGKSYADAVWSQHAETCPHGAVEDFEHSADCGYRHWREMLPSGDGWQLWTTVGDGPESPVFATAEELIEWMSRPVPPEKQSRWRPGAYPAQPWAQGWQREQAEALVLRLGEMPSMVIMDGRIQTPKDLADRCARGEAGR